MWISIQLHWLVIEACVHSDQHSCYINHNDQEKEQGFI